MNGLWRNVAFLYEKGHHNAAELPIGIVWEFADLHTHVVNRQMATLGKMISQIAASTMGSEEAHEQLKKTFEMLSL